MSNPRQNAPDAAERERAHEALKLRTAGLQWSEIAERVGYTDESGPRHAVNRLLSRQEAESAETYREVERRRLELVMRGHIAAAVSGDVNAASVVLRTHDRISKLFGLDAPQQVEINPPVSDTEFAARMAEILSVLDPRTLRQALEGLPGLSAALLNAPALSALPKGDDTRERFCPGSVALSDETHPCPTPEEWCNP
ncbi:hypothetical protein J8M97_09430 [Gordonia polyisoprenivorans]|uniref:hypothetical protein n=1 Tax=Gordonia polyisoprenivorans TaxID=84595 RepID=UPI001B8D348E|nr:hypothetical protein [Gordonia polyisoprenivorans]QUD84766.1 hypothetical protein J8M97_09430 [Gordonia polyisoprenivorans]